MKSFAEWINDTPSLKVLDNDVQRQRLAQSYLVVGESQPSWSFVLAFAQSLQCPEKPGEGCGVCPICCQIASETFVDLRRIKPSGKAQFIKIEDIYQLHDLIQTRPIVAKQRICFIQDVQCFDKEAANAFLKILEEPPQGTLWILSTPNLYDVLETLVSRCRRVVLGFASVASFVDKDLQGKDEIQQDLLKALQNPHSDALATVVDRINETVHKAKLNDRGNKEYLEYTLGLIQLLMRDSALLRHVPDSGVELMWPAAENVSLSMSQYMDEVMRDLLNDRLHELHQNLDYNMNLKLSLSHLLSPLSGLVAGGAA